MSSVTLHRVSLRYPSGTMGLQDVDLHVDDGEFLALVGPSGSGKTTLLRTVAGFLDPTRGTLSLGERMVAGIDPCAPYRRLVSVPPEQRQLGVVFQQHAVWPHWSVGHNVEYPLRAAHLPRAERRRRIEEALALVGLEGFAQRDPATLSGGQRQRVALARALVCRPRVLLLDEALSALDEPARDQLRRELYALTRELGLTVIHVTHDRSEALTLADRVAVMDAGRIGQVGSPEQLAASPATPFVAQFLSDATLVEGTLGPAGFAGAHGLHLPRWAQLPRSGTGFVAILPDAVEVDDGPRTNAVVRSSLLTAQGSEVVLDMEGLILRARCRGWHPTAGQRVSVRVSSAIFYPGDRPATSHPARLGRIPAETVRP